VGPARAEPSAITFRANPLSNDPDHLTTRRNRQHGRVIVKRRDLSDSTRVIRFPALVARVTHRIL
jgi:hypothetical protein